MSRERIFELLAEEFEMDEQTDETFDSALSTQHSALSLGPCCCCEAVGPIVRNVLMLDEKSPTPGKGWGCVVCDLPQDGAIAVKCDACLESRAALKWACAGWPGEDGRVPIESLVGRHEHDPRYHPELEHELPHTPEATC